MQVSWPFWMTKIVLMFYGWYPGRSVFAKLKLPSGVECFPAAKVVLSQFGGLKIGYQTHDRYVLIPSEVAPIVEDLPKLEKLIGQPLFPLGICNCSDTEYWLIDTEGIVYIFDGDGLRPVASNFKKALTYIVFEYWNGNTIHKDLERVGLAGKRWYVNAE